jgi:hypothetical protein
MVLKKKTKEIFDKQIAIEKYRFYIPRLWLEKLKLILLQ